MNVKVWQRFDQLSPALLLISPRHTIAPADPAAAFAATAAVDAAAAFSSTAPW